MNSQILDEIDPNDNHFSVLNPDFRLNFENQYYDVDEFNSECSVNGCGVNDLSVIHVNVRSLRKNGDPLSVYLSLLRRKFDIICLSETWLKTDEYCDHFPNHKCFVSSRLDRRGGGVAVFVNNKFSANAINDLIISEPHLECIFIRIEMKRKSLIVGSCYRPPDTDFIAFNQLLGQKLSTLTRTCKNIIVCGDFNLDLLDLDNSSVSAFNNTMNSLCLTPTITKPTRITDSSCKLIDNIFSSNMLNFNSGILKADISDHLPIFIIYKNYFANLESSPQKITYRIVNDSTLSNLRNSLQAENLLETLDVRDINSSIETLHRKILYNFEHHCPVKTKTVSPKDMEKPWINYEIKNEMKKRQNYFNLYQRNLISKPVYNSVRNAVTNKIKLAKKNFYLKRFNDCKSDMKKTWCIINSVFKSKSNFKSKQIESIIFNNETYTANSDIASAFNNHFASIAKRIEDSLPGNSSNGNTTDDTSFSSSGIPNSFFFRPTCESEINRIILNLKNKKSGINTYSTIIVKQLSCILTPILSKLINTSLVTGHFPDFLKVARVIPLYKTGDVTNVNNYRPISVLPILSKIFEKVAHKQLYNFFESFKLFQSCQFGFRQKLSTSHAVNHNIRKIYDILDRGDTAVSVFLDFCKAFDCVDHTILLSKMHKYGVRGMANNWFKSYLSNRMQYVSVNNVNSETCPIDRGVPQGSILGPLLFLIFINDFPNCTNFFQFTLFADDSTLTCSFKNKTPQQISSELSNNLIAIRKWTVRNKLKINYEKSKIVVFSFRKNIHIGSVQIGNDLIDQVSSTKFLGLVIDEHLNFRNHVNSLCSRLSRNVGILFKLKEYFPSQILKMLYNSLILPYLTYCIEAWYAAPNYLSHRVHVLQKKSIRAIYDLNYNDHTNDYFKCNSILKLKDLYNVRACSLVFKYIRLNENNDLNLTCHSDVHRYNTRNANKLVAPRYNRTATKSTYMYRSVNEWNTLPENLTHIDSIRKFIPNLKKYYIGLY